MHCPNFWEDLNFDRVRYIVKHTIYIWLYFIDINKMYVIIDVNRLDMTEK